MTEACDERLQVRYKSTQAGSRKICRSSWYGLAFSALLLHER